MPLVTCKTCNTEFDKDSHEIRTTLRHFCSKKCTGIGDRTRSLVLCHHCGTEFGKLPNQMRRSKSGRSFCSKSCSASYNNTHKTHGTRRSKLEIWLESELRTLYPDLEMLFNEKEAINSELDIYIPSLNFAVELNGIFHYEPIYGVEKLNQTKNNDTRKFQACLEKKIELMVIDVSTLSYFKPASAKKYLDIITNIINQKRK